MAEENTKRMIEELRIGIDALGDDKLDSKFLDSDEFTALVLRTLELNARVSRAEKNELFARILLGFLHGEGPREPYKDGYLRLIDELEPEHIVVLGIFYRGSMAANETAPHSTAEHVADELGMPVSLMLAYCSQLVRYGLIRDWGIGKWDYRPGQFDITDYGKDICQHLAADGNAAT